MAVFDVGCRLGYQVTKRTTFVFNIEAAQLDRQRVLSENLTITPNIGIDTYRMPESANRYVRLTCEPGALQLAYQARVELDPHTHNPADVAEVPPGRLPLDTLTHLYPSRYCQADKLQRFALKIFGAFERGHQRVTAICNWIHDNVDYMSGSTDAMTSAFDTVLQRAGVCRDFAHLAIALCRALGIPARYVSAFANHLSPPDFHAILEAYLIGPEGGAWYLFDPTRRAATDGIVRIGIGRDAGEIAFATIFGEVKPGIPEVWIREDGAAPGVPLLTTQAVTIATF
jgi:transglutaminase-like putative cysteine protease